MAVSSTYACQLPTATTHCQLIRMTRWGILGLGRIAHKFVQDLLTVEGAILHAVAASDQERANEFGNQYGAAHRYGSYNQLLTCPDLDVVYIATRHVQHCDNTLLLLNAGIPVLCEKPFGMDAGQVNQMVETARNKNVFLMEALWSRFMPAILKAHELIQSGAIGRVRMVRANFGFPAPFSPETRLFNKALGGEACWILVFTHCFCRTSCSENPPTFGQPLPLDQRVLTSNVA